MKRYRFQCRQTLLVHRTRVRESSWSLGDWPTLTAACNLFPPSMQKHAPHRRLVEWLEKYGKSPSLITKVWHRQSYAGGVKTCIREILGVSPCPMWLEWYQGLPLGWLHNVPLGTV